MPATLDIPGLDRFLDGIVDIAANPRADEPLRKGLEVAVGEMGRALTSGRAVDGTPHPPIKESTRKRRSNPGGPPLIDGGDMMVSLLGDGQGHFESVTGDEATLGTLHNKNGSSPPISVVHQLGSTKRNIPARPFVGVNDTVADATADLVAAHIETRIGAL